MRDSYFVSESPCINKSGTTSSRSRAVEVSNRKTNVNLISRAGNFAEKSPVFCARSFKPASRNYEPVCFKCHVLGHYIWECPSFRRQASRGHNRSGKFIRPRERCNNPRIFSMEQSRASKAVRKSNVKGFSSVVPRISVDLGPTQVIGLIDSGAVRSIMSSDLFSRLAPDSVKGVRPVNLECRTASNGCLRITREAQCRVKIAGFSWVFTILVAPQLSFELVLGADFMTHTQLVLDMFGGDLYFKFNPAVRIPFYPAKLSSASPPKLLNVVAGDTLGHLSGENKERMARLIARHPEVLTKKLGRTTVLEYDIAMKDDAVVKSTPFPLLGEKLSFMREHVDKLEKEGVIEPSVSPFASPVFLVNREGRKPRMVVDYRKLNNHVSVEGTPVPNLHESFHHFTGANFFTVLDLNSAYHQIPLSERSKKYTAICLPWRLYQFKVIPFGLATGGLVLTRLLDEILHDLKFKCVFNYLDDLVIYSPTFESHLNHLEEVLTRLGRAGLTVNPEKAVFGVPEIKFLGHLVSARGVAVDPDRTQAIRSFPRPRDVKGVARFIGMVLFFSKFIPNFSEIAAPLNMLRKKGQKFVWGTAQQEGFDKLKEAIISPPVLRMADFKKPFILQTDASSKALGAVLLQEFEGTRCPIAYASRSLTPSEQRSSSAYESECLAVVFGVEKFRSFLEHREFVLETDNQALSWMLSHSRQLGKLGRWVARLTSLKFQVSHIRGTQNVIADALSRTFEPEETEVETTPMCASLLLNFPLGYSDIGASQAQDSELLPIIESLRKGESNPRFCLSRGVLCKADREGIPKQIYVPSSLVDLIFKYYHESPIGGHLGFFKTRGKIFSSFYWPSINRDIKTRIKNCSTCAISKPCLKSKVGFLSSRVPTRPMEKLYLDHVGKLPRTKNGNAYILVVVDAFSKFTWLCPVREVTSKTTIKALNTYIFQNFGFPSIVISDNHSSFTSHLFKNFCFSHSIKHATISAYHAEANMVERYNRNLKASLIAYHSASQNTWDESLPWLQQAFNSALNESSMHTPSEVVLKFRPTSPLSLSWNINELLPDPNSNHDVVKVWREVRGNLLKAHERHKIVYNKNRYPNPYKIGDIVWCKTHPKSSAIDKRAAKLMPRYSGPFRIFDFLTPVTVSLGNPNSNEVVKKAHISHLKPYTGEVT